MAPTGSRVAQDGQGEQPAQTTNGQGTAQGGAKFTPGPWRVGDVRVLVLSRAGSVLAQTDLEPHIPDAQARANAHLIAAAPEMYEALSALIGWVEAETDGRDWPNSILEGARLVLIKAEGR